MKTNYMIASLNNLTSKKTKKDISPFWIMAGKEIYGFIRSWRFLVLLILIIMTFLGSMYVSLSNLKEAVAKVESTEELFLYLKLLTATGGVLPPFHVFINFLGPILGISLGFDAINSERQNRTLIRIMAQPVYRDNVLLAKFTAAILLVSVMFITLALLMIGGGLITTGVPIEPEEVLRIFFYILVCVCYVAFWLSLSMLFSIKFKQASTSALTAIGFWLFFTVFYQIVVKVIANILVPNPQLLSQQSVMRYNEIIMGILHLAPSQLYADATTTLLMPSVRSLGPLTMQQMAGAIPSSLSISNSLLIVWPQISGLIAVTLLLFALAYYIFMREEIKG